MYVYVIVIHISIHITTEYPNIPFPFQGCYFIFCSCKRFLQSLHMAKQKQKQINEQKSLHALARDYMTRILHIRASLFFTLYMTSSWVKAVSTMDSQSKHPTNRHNVLTPSSSVSCTSPTPPTIVYGNIRNSRIMNQHMTLWANYLKKL